MVLMTRAKANRVSPRRSFENRFMHVQELPRLGADIHASASPLRTSAACRA